MTELCLAAALLAGGGFGAARGVRYLRADARDAVAAPSPRRPAPLGARRDLSSLPDLRVALETTGTFLGMSDELLLDRVRTQPIARFKLNHGGSSLSFRVEFADGSRAAWKPMQTNMQSVPRKEVAAYRLNRLLGPARGAARRAARRDARGAARAPAPREPAVPAAHQGRDGVRPRRQAPSGRRRTGSRSSRTRASTRPTAAGRRRRG